MHSCSKELLSKDSKPKMSSTPVIAENLAPVSSDELILPTVHLKRPPDPIEGGLQS